MATVVCVWVGVYGWEDNFDVSQAWDQSYYFVIPGQIGDA